jgi:hypothetical protein
MIKNVITNNFNGESNELSKRILGIPESKKKVMAYAHCLYSFIAGRSNNFRSNKRFSPIYIYTILGCTK